MVSITRHQLCVARSKVISLFVEFVDTDRCLMLVLWILATSSTSLAFTVQYLPFWSSSISSGHRSSHEGKSAGTILHQRYPRVDS
ncbi:hypothetical protein C8J55DRAFT_504346 [Lentinula edodes]|uniref:Uncharacterized protein n=1 Tax=Lentinula lateritia TaxID=40482 RepID=A0A9W9AXP0_9AGAR|nr:hypothetical protein C8J55DRAFT_504346 [Lentinula edodes]